MGYLTGARTDLADTIATALPAVDVYPYPTVPDSILTDSVVVATTGAGPSIVAVLGVRTRLDVWCISATTVGAAAEDDLETLTDSVLTALDAAGIQWTDTERAVWQDANPAYRIEVET